MNREIINRAQSQCEDAIDRCAKAQGQTRSGLLASAAIRYMADQTETTKPRPAFRRNAKANAKKARK